MLKSKEEIQADLNAAIKAAKCHDRIEVFKTIYVTFDVTDEDSFAWDLIADLWHWCQANGVDFENAVRLGRDNAQAEMEDIA